MRRAGVPPGREARQAPELAALPQIQRRTHDRAGRNQRRRSLVADEVGETTYQLAMGNVVKQKWHGALARALLFAVVNYNECTCKLIPKLNVKFNILYCFLLI